MKCCLSLNIYICKYLKIGSYYGYEGFFFKLPYIISIFIFAFFKVIKYCLKT